MRTRGSALVQFASPSSGEGKTTIASFLGNVLSNSFKVCLVQLESAALPTSGGENTELEKRQGLAVLRLPLTQPVEERLAELRQRFHVVLLDNESVPLDPPGSNILAAADVTCLLVAAGHTTRHVLRALRKPLTHLKQGVVFILNYFEDPLPQWIH